MTLYNNDEFAPARVIHRLYFGGLLLLALVGAALTVKRWRDVALLWFVQISMTITYVVFHPRRATASRQTRCCSCFRRARWWRWSNRSGG